MDPKLGEDSPSELTLLARVRAVLEIMRVSNLLTLVGPVLVGAALTTHHEPIPWQIVAVVFAGVAAIYTGAMALNDVFDARVDARARPRRPIPSGRIPLRVAAILGAGLLLVGVGTLLSLGATPGALGAAIALCALLYDALHKRFAPTALFLGACRGLVYPLSLAAAAFALGVHPDWSSTVAPATGVAVYTAIITLAARREASDERHPGRAVVVFAPVAALSAALGIQGAFTGAAITIGAALVVWTVYAIKLAVVAPRKPVSATMGFIAAFCLIDALLLALLGDTTLALAVVGCFIATLAAQRFVPGS